MKIKYNQYFLVLVILWSQIVVAIPPEIYINSTKNEYLINQGEIQLFVKAKNLGEEIRVDAHIGIIAPDGTIYEYPNWNTTLQPSFSNLILPQGFAFEAFLLGGIPLDGSAFPVTQGTYQVIGVLTKPNTMDIVSNITPSAIFVRATVTDGKGNTGITGNSGGFSVAQISGATLYMIVDINDVRKIIFNPNGILDIYSADGRQVVASEPWHIGATGGLWIGMPNNEEDPNNYQSICFQNNQYFWTELYANYHTSDNSISSASANSIYFYNENDAKIASNDQVFLFSSDPSQCNDGKYDY